MKSIILANEFLAETRLAQPITLESLCGISLLERHLRTLNKCGARSISIIVPRGPGIANMVAQKIKKLGKLVEVIPEDRAAQNLKGDDDVLVIAGDYFIERQFLEYLVNEPRSCLLVDREKDKHAGETFTDSPDATVGCARISSATLCSLFQKNTYNWADIVQSLTNDETVPAFDVGALPTYNHAVRRHRRSKWMKVTNRAGLRKARNWAIEGAQKGSLDLPAQVLHAPIENHIVSRLCEASITPNQLTLVTNIAAWLVTWGILSGFVWISLVGAALVGIMDGLDGKLARVKVMTSKVGEMEHFFDMLFEYSWWLSLGWMLGGTSYNSTAFMAGVGLVIVNFADVVIGVIFWALLGRSHNRTIDNYTPFELSVRKIAGRRNIYIWLLLISGPFVGLEAALWLCVWWGIITIFIRGGRALWLVGTRQSPMDFAF